MIGKHSALFAQPRAMTEADIAEVVTRFADTAQAAEEAGLPIGVHAFGFGGNPITASGWPSYYIEEMVGHSQCQQTALASIVLEGVLEMELGDEFFRLWAGDCLMMRFDRPTLFRNPTRHPTRYAVIISHAAARP